MLSLKPPTEILPAHSPFKVDVLVQEDEELFLHTSYIHMGNLQQDIRTHRTHLGKNCLSQDCFALVQDVRQLNLHLDWYVFSVGEMTLIVRPMETYNLQKVNSLLHPLGYLAGVTPNQTYWVACLHSDPYLEYRNNHRSGTIPLGNLPSEQVPYLNRLADEPLESQ